MIQDRTLIFFSYALRLKLISFQTVNDWIYSMIDTQDDVDCPDHFFEMASMSEPQLLDFFADQRFASRATPDLEVAKSLCQYFIKEKKLPMHRHFLY